MKKLPKRHQGRTITRAKYEMQAGRLERLMHGLGAAPEDEILFSIEQPLFLEELAQEIDELCRRRLQNNLKYNLVQVELQPAPYGTQLLIRLV